MTELALGRRWALGVMTLGLMCVGDDEELRIDIEGPFDMRLRLLEALRDGTAADEVAEITGVPEGEAAALLDRLVAAGALSGEASASAPDVPARFGDVLADVLAGQPAVTCATAEELLVVPDDLPVHLARGVFKRFIAGVDPPGRRGIYSYAAIWAQRTTAGDLPDPAELEPALAVADGLDRARVHVIDILRDCAVQSADPEEVQRLGAGASHRLGPVLSVLEPKAMGAPGGEVHLASARWSAPNVRAPQLPDEDWARGMARSGEEAELIARAEAAERHASGDLSNPPLIRARAADLHGVVDPAGLYALNERQLETATWLRPYDAEAVNWWMPATTPGGERRWVIADAVFYPFPDPHVEAPQVVPASSNGVAAYSDFAGARERALRELVERDAFMYAWVQRISREAIAEESLPDDVREHLESLRRHDGFDTKFINLTLDTDPVVLCAIGGDRDIRLGASCRRDPVEAVRKALVEADGIRFSTMIDAGPPESLEEVERPRDHFRVFRDPAARAQAAFLTAAPDSIALEDLAPPAASFEDSLAEIAEPLAIDLTTPSTQPFHVVRAIVPGLIQISFGYDHEPLGMSRLAEPKHLSSGRTVGKAFDLTRFGPILPHPFP